MPPLCLAARANSPVNTFDPQDFWDFWGGRRVTFEWISDTIPQGYWGNQAPPINYPVVQLPDRTLMMDGPRFRVVFGGTDFVVTNPAYLTAMNLNTASAIPLRLLPSVPADGTLLRDADRPEVYVVYGGAKFHIPPPTLFDLGFYDRGKVNIVPPGGTAKVGTRPIDGTLLKERSDPRVYLVANQRLSWITSPAAMDRMCLAWRHVRTVPDNALAGLTRGPDII
jgi:hypothetical protein